MAEVILKNIKKIYPHQEPKKKKKGEPEKKTNLQITEEGVLAVDNFNLHIQDKEFIVLVGPSGCGKSTTLRMVAGLEEISGGELYIGGQLMNDVAPKDRDISMVFQNYALYPHMTVRENIAFPLKLRKMDKAEIDQRVEQAAEILDITEYLDRKPKALSGGQRQRVAIGRAIVREPKVLLMDEPLSNLDAKLRNQMRAELIKLRQRINTTFIYVTHDQTEAMTLGDRIVIMKDGVIQQIGTPQEVFNHPANLFVAGFIGMPQMNFYDAELVLEDGTVCRGAGRRQGDPAGGEAGQAEGQRRGSRSHHAGRPAGAPDPQRRRGLHDPRHRGRQRDDGQRRPSPRQRLRQRYHYDRSHHGAGKHLCIHHRQPYRLYLQRRYGPSFRPEYPEKSGSIKRIETVDKVVNSPRR